MSPTALHHSCTQSLKRLCPNLLKLHLNPSFIASNRFFQRSFGSKSRKKKDYDEPVFITSPGQNRWRTLSDSPPEQPKEKVETPPESITVKADNTPAADIITPADTEAEDNLLSEEYNFNTGYEKLSPEQEAEKAELVKELTKQLRGPLADENGNIPTGDKRPIAIEVDGPSHFYANSTNYTAYTKLKHRLLTRMGYKVLHVPYFEWRRLRGAKEREEYMRAKLEEEPTEWLDPEDEKFYTERLDVLKQQFENTTTKPKNEELNN